MKTGALALLALLMLAATPEDCNMPTKYMGNVSIHSLETPADGGTVFNDRPVFNAGIEIPEADSIMQGMEGPLLVIDSSYSADQDTVALNIYWKFITFTSDELVGVTAYPGMMAKAEIISEIIGVNDVKTIKLFQGNPFSGVEIAHIDIPAELEGYVKINVNISYLTGNEHWIATLLADTEVGLYGDKNRSIDPLTNTTEFWIGLEYNVGTADVFLMHNFNSQKFRSKS